MPSLPLPFVGALLLAILCARLVAGSEPGRRITPPLVFVAACTLDLVVVGLRWSTDLAAIRALQPVVAATLPPLAWLCLAVSPRLPPWRPLPLAVPGLPWPWGRRHEAAAIEIRIR